MLIKTPKTNSIEGQ